MQSALALVSRSTSSAPMQPIRRPFGPRVASSINHTWARLALGIQPKLSVSEPGDPFERAADAVADQVMRMAQPTAVDSACPQRSFARIADPVDPVQRAAAENSDTPPDTELAMRVASHSGSLLPASLRTYFDPRFGRDFNDVRIHAGSEADAAAASVQARAFTVGHHVTPSSASNVIQRQPANVSTPVLASSLRVTTPFAGSQPTFQNWGGGVICKSPVFAAQGSVTIPAAMADGDLTVGFMQSLVGLTGPKGHYWDANDAPYMSSFAPYASLPLRDGDSGEGGIFYGPEAQSQIGSATATVSMGDQPQGSLPWTTPDKKGRLQQIVGESRFVTWLVVKSDSTGRLYPLRYLAWRIGWFAAVDSSLPTGTSFAMGEITDWGEGEGPMAPIRSGPVANDSVLPTRWEPWSG
jgi:hypothetical protein